MLGVGFTCSAGACGISGRRKSKAPLKLITGGAGATAVGFLCSKKGLTALYHRRDAIGWVKKLVVWRLQQSRAVIVFQLREVNLSCHNQIFEDVPWQMPNSQCGHG